jgi:uncharacterized protein YwgA
MTQIRHLKYHRSAYSKMPYSSHLSSMISSGISGGVTSVFEGFRYLIIAKLSTIDRVGLF